ncbi:MAG: hypothetical protein COV48_04875 [Elusimicrobia bacterium CG11_big_fil_rev_8_21_14_0_20_64_6]|nr:MAG: hypothetical protein COV48_04875 [Elusimicrobia bacterium CG11_big_fil_rev_8_21_14_0_20_64_6]
MKKTLIAALGAVLLCAGPSFAKDKHDHKGHDAKPGAVVTISGEMLDMACYMAHEGKGEKHAKCAEMCVKGGAPLGVLTKDGKVYLVVNDHGKEAPFAEAKALAGMNAKIIGKVVERGGVRAIIVEKAEKL